MAINEDDEELSDFMDDDYACEESDVDEDDDLMYRENVFNEEAYNCLIRVDDLEDERPLDVSSGEDFRSDSDENQEMPIYNNCTKYNPIFEIGQRFKNKEEFKEAIVGYSAKERRNVRYEKNDKIRIYVKCADEKCDWRIHALKVSNESTFQVRKYVPKHTCNTTMQVKRLSSKWLGNKYEHLVRSDPKRSIKGLHADIERDMNCQIPIQKVYRAKRYALEAIEGSFKDQYGCLWDYAEAIRKANPGSTVIMALEDNEQRNQPKRFSSFYVCFKALRDGFLSGCRPLIGVDGCHLKGPHKGILLTAVSMDPNNNLFPIAYGVVGSETFESWKWFLELLGSDLRIEVNDEKKDDAAYTFISDKQKGLVPAMDEVFPNAKRRFCVRHLHGNLKVAGFRGLPYKLALWNAANATTVPDFENAMQVIGELDTACLQWLSDKPPSEWSRSHFDTSSKCDTLLNNMCESFNACILDAREKPILAMLEWIRVFMMTRLQVRRDCAKKQWLQKKKLKICPRIHKILEKNKDKAGLCRSVKSDDLHYEVDCEGRKYVVDLGTRTCTCRRWELSGIPCVHAVRAITHRGNDGESEQDYVDECYTVETFMRIYEHAIKPMPGPEMWEKTPYDKCLPPKVVRGVGRPKKARRMEPDEVRSQGKKKSTIVPCEMAMRRQSFKVTCKFCGQKGHNTRGCRLRKEGGSGPSKGPTQPDEMTQPDGYPQASQDGLPNASNEFPMSSNNVVPVKKSMSPSGSSGSESMVPVQQNTERGMNCNQATPSVSFTNCSTFTVPIINGKYVTLGNLHTAMNCLEAMEKERAKKKKDEKTGK